MRAPRAAPRRRWVCVSLCPIDLRWLAEPSRAIGFAISADMTTELRKVCVAAPADAWQLFEQRQDRTVDLAEVEFAPGNWQKDALPLRYLVLRHTPLQGALFHDGSSERYFAVVTNRQATPADLVEWHTARRPAPSSTCTT